MCTVYLYKLETHDYRNSWHLSDIYWSMFPDSPTTPLTTIDSVEDGLSSFSGGSVETHPPMAHKCTMICICYVTSTCRRSYLRLDFILDLDFHINININDGKLSKLIQNRLQCICAKQEPCKQEPEMGLWCVDKVSFVNLLPKILQKRPMQ